MDGLHETADGLENVVCALPVEETDCISRRLFEAAGALGAISASIHGESSLNASAECIVVAAENIEKAEVLLSEARKRISDYAVSIGAANESDEVRPDTAGQDVFSAILDEVPDRLGSLIRQTNPIQFYRDLAAQAPRLNHEQRTELCRRIEAGAYARKLLKESQGIPLAWKSRGVKEGLPTEGELDLIAEEGEVAFEMMVLANVPLVVMCANRVGVKMPYAEKLRYGIWGLLLAIRKFDFRRKASHGPTTGEGVKFSTYAYLRIKGAIERADAKANATDYGLSILDYERKRYIIGKAMELSNRLEREPTDEEIAKEISYPVADVAWLRRVEKKESEVVYLDDDHPGVPGLKTNHELIPDMSPGSGPNDIHRVELRQVLQNITNSLEPHEMFLLDVYLGLSCNRLTLKKIVDLLGSLPSDSPYKSPKPITHPRGVSKAANEILKRLRERLPACELNDLLQM